MTDAQKAELVGYVRRLARAVLERAPAEAAPAFLHDLPYGGAFVTLRRAGQLRGCMGRLRASGPFDEALADIVDSSLHDPRFLHDPITLAELPELRIEISVLTEVVPVADAGQLVAGRHGIVVACGGRSGCFLPQVATEQGWSIEEFLSECCRMKAGLPPDAWKSPETRIEAFEVEIAGET